MRALDGIRKAASATSEKGLTLVGKVHRYETGGAVPYVVEQLQHDNSLVVVCHRSISRAERRPEIPQFAAPRDKSTDVGTPVGGILIHTGCVPVPAERVPEVLPGLPSPTLDLINAGKCRVFAARWTYSGGDKPDVNLVRAGYVHIEPDNEKEVLRYAVQSGKYKGRQRESLRLHFIEGEPAPIASASELHEKLRNALASPYARAWIFAAAYDGKAEDFERIEVYAGAEGNPDKALALRRAALDAIAAALQQGTAAVSVAREQGLLLGEAYYEAVKKGLRKLPSCAVGWMPAVVVARRNDDGTMGPVVGVIANTFDAEQPVPGKDSMLAAVYQAHASGPREYTADMARSDRQAASAGAVDEAVDRVAGELGAQEPEAEEPDGGLKLF